MDAYFVRVYTMMDGTKHEVNVRYETYEQAESDLHMFCPSKCVNCGSGVDDMALVSYVSIEKRFSPTPLWTQEN